MKREKEREKKKKRGGGTEKSENEYLNPSEPSVGAFYCRLSAITLKFQTRVNKCTRIPELYACTSLLREIFVSKGSLRINPAYLFIIKHRAR